MLCRVFNNFRCRSLGADGQLLLTARRRAPRASRAKRNDGPTLREVLANPTPLPSYYGVETPQHAAARAKLEKAGSPVAKPDRLTLLIVRAERQLQDAHNEYIWDTEYDRQKALDAAEQRLSMLKEEQYKENRRRHGLPSESEESSQEDGEFS
jgi:hypothetical protein